MIEMKSRILVFVMGLVAGGLIVGLAALWYGRNQYDAGFHSGEVLAGLQFLNKVKANLGDDYERSEGYSVFLEVKDTAVLIVERNGVKTLRAYK